jgi:RIO kinase 1
MKIPKRLQPLLQEGLIDAVLRQLMSGKEASVFVVRCGEEIRCAKVYKEAHQRSFRQAATYTEGRQVKNSRQARAIQKGSRYGRESQEALWQNTEVDALFRLAAAGVAVPTPYQCIDGVLLMALVTDAEGNAAPRLNDVPFREAEAEHCLQQLLQAVVGMLAAGLIHGDLSEYNVLMSGNGPVIIDFPQVINAAAHQQGEAMLRRDVDNLTRFFSQFAPALAGREYGAEIWQRYQHGELQSTDPLTGIVAPPKAPAQLDEVMASIELALKEEQARQRFLAELNKPADGA